MKAINLLALVIAFVATAMIASAQTSFTITVGPSPISITTTTTSSIVTVKEQNANPNSYYITDSHVGPSQFLVPAGSPYTFSQGGGYASGTVIGTIQMASNVITQFLVTQTGTGGSPAKILVQPTTCPASLSVTAINVDGSLVCSGGSGGSVTSVTGTANQIDVATGTTTPTLSIDSAFIFPGTANGKFIGGISNSSSYTGSSLDVQMNAAISDALALANGNTSGLVDSSASGGVQTIASQITIGNNTQFMSLRLPPYCDYFATGFSGGTTSAIVQDGATNISSLGGRAGCTINGNSTTDGVYALYQTGAGAYFQLDGISFYNRGTATASGASVLIGNSNDNSYWSDSVILNYIAGGEALKIGGTSLGSPCCSNTFNRDTLYNNNTGGVVLDIEGSNSFGTPRDLYFFGGSAGHPAASTAVILCNDTSTNHYTQWAAFGYYLETNTTDTTTAPIQSTGCGRISAYGLGIEKTSAGASSAPAVTFDTTADVIANLADVQLYNFNFPAVVAQNNATAFCPVTPCKVMSNTTGRLAHYTKGRAWADDETLFSSQDTVIANEGSTGTTLNKLAKLTGAPATVILAATSDTGGIMGPVTGGAGTTGSATVAVSGQAQCVFANATTAGDYVGISNSTAGDCVDLGAVKPSTGQIIGRAMASGSAGTYWVLLYGPDINPPTNGIPASQNITPVTVSANSTSAQLLQEIPLKAGVLNSINQTYFFDALGVYTDGAAQTPTLTFTVQLCTVSGCGSGTVVTLASATSGATATASNDPWRINGPLVTGVSGSSGQVWASGTFAVDLGAGASVSQSVYQSAPALSSAIDLTAALFLDVTVTTSTGSTGNSITQNLSVLAPQSNPSNGGLTNCSYAPTYIQGFGANATSFTQNSNRVWAFNLPCQLQSIGLVYDTLAADNTANLYNLALFNGAGVLVAQIGPTAGTSFAASTGIKTISWTSPASLSPGRYYIGLTTNCSTSCATLAGSNAVVMPAANVAEGTTSGAVMPGSFTPPSDSWTSNNMVEVIIH